MKKSIVIMILCVAATIIGCGEKDIDKLVGQIDKIENAENVEEKKDTIWDEKIDDVGNGDEKNKT